MTSRDTAEIVAVTEQINGLLDDLARTVAELNAVLNGRAAAGLTTRRSFDDR